MPRQEIDLKDQFFGMELEFTGITREQAADIIAEHFGVPTSSIHRSTSSPYYTQSIIANGREWKVMRDSSVTTKRTNNDTSSQYYSSSLSDYSCELVTPKCKHDQDMKDIQEIVRKLRAAGAKVNKDCGLHVHVDGKNHDVRSLVNLSKMMWAREDILYRALDFSPQRSQWCAKTSQEYIDRLDDRKPTTKEELRYCWYGDNGYHGHHYDPSRYRALNLHAYFTKGTVEFRCYNSTLHAGKVKAYIEFSLGCSARAINMGKTSIKEKTQSSNECYTFRTFLIKIPLNGDEYSTCRYHMLANLVGDKAWKNREEAMRRRAERAQLIRDRLTELSDSVGEQLTPERLIAEPEREDSTRSITTRQQIIELLEEVQSDTSITSEERTALRLILGFREQPANAQEQTQQAAQSAPQNSTQSSVQQWLGNGTGNQPAVTPFTPNTRTRH